MYSMHGRIFTALLLLWFITGCASRENFVKTYENWVGKSIHHFTAQAGYPDATYPLPNGHMVYVYEKTRIASYPAVSPAFGYGWGGYYGGMMIGYGTEIDYRTCKLFLEVNKKGTIVHWGARGNHCIK